MAARPGAVKGAEVFNPFYPPSANGFPQYQSIGQVEVDPNDGERVIAGTKTGLYLSYDGGDNWTGPCLANGFTSQRQDTTGIVLRDLGATTEIIVAIGTRGFETPVQPDLNRNGANGIYKGTLPASGCPTDFAAISRADNGWPAGAAGGTPTPANPLGRIDLAIAPSDDRVIYAQVAEIDAGSPNILGVWRSDDAGLSWTQATIGDVGGAGSQSWYNAGLAVHPSDPNTVILSALNTFRSTTGGSAFANIAASPHVDHHGRAFVAGDPNRLLIGTDGGVYYSGNAMAAAPAWTSLNATLNTIEFYSGGISANFNTAPTRQCRGRRAGQLVHGVELERRQLRAASVGGAQRRRRLLQHHRADPGQSLVLLAARTATSASPRPRPGHLDGVGDALGLGRRPQELPDQLRPVPLRRRGQRLPAGHRLRPHHRRLVPGVGERDRRRAHQRLEGQQPGPDQGHAGRALDHQPGRLRDRHADGGDRRHQRWQRRDRLRHGPGRGGLARPGST